MESSKTIHLSQWTIYLWLLRVCKQTSLFVVLMCVLQAGIAAIGVGYALLMRDAIDSAAGHNSSRFFTLCVIFIMALMLQIILRAVYIYIGERSKSSIDNRLRSTVFEGILRSDAAFATRYHSGELINRLTSDITVVSENITTLAPITVSMTIRLVGVIAVMFVLSPELTGMFICAGLVMGMMSMLLRNWLKHLHQRVQEAEGAVRSFIQECLENLLVIRAFGVQAKILRHAEMTMKSHQQARMRRIVGNDIASTGLTFAVQGGYALGFIWCGHGLLAGTITYGTLLAVIQLIGQIQTPFVSLGSIFPQHAALLASTERLIDLLPQRHSSARNENNACFDINDTSLPASLLYQQMMGLSFRDVNFSYGRNNVLHNFSYTIHKGDFIAITGRSGIGKSTLLKLILGSYVPQSGKIVLEATDGKNKYDLEPNAIPDGFYAYVPQGNGLMSGTIREAVALSDPHDDSSLFDEERIRWACTVADAAHFIEQLPQQYDTILGEHGAGLSEGQMQRLAVARALYSQAPILLLDESTSALDAKSEYNMLSRIKALHNRTVLIVSHRKEVLGFCNQIVHLDYSDQENM
ncbi:ABC transporter ATP-binding protein [Bifidobacterium scaligerum]|uniref:ABC transporter ATP-binding protein n=1 Tax=Bifidobacterium scaligerum TaxID=2052656 RepID=A0A2M9HPA4_9BIFI|nr:ABC transporter ATP-binding protein [Bifidobacterium scaligerum]PJM78658.1 hypothetical protein CUU80_07915 [Bifidobacterium scaligerum]